MSNQNILTRFLSKTRINNRTEKIVYLKLKTKDIIVSVGFHSLYKIVEQTVFEKKTRKVPVFGHGCSHINEEYWELTNLTPQDVYTMRDNFIKQFFNIEKKK